MAPQEFESLPPDARRFCLAGLEVALLPAGPGGLDGLAGYYDAYPTAGAPPGLVLDVERIPGFGRGRARGPEYPGFRAELASPDTIALSRFDAEGTLTLPPAQAGPEAERRPRAVRGRFRVGDSPNSIEAAVRIGVSLALPRRGGLVMHASAVAAAGQAAVFAGHSGAGKSTIAAMLMDHVPGLEKLSDELVVLAPTGPEKAWEAHVTPFIGSAGLTPRLRRPVAGVHFLLQAPGHRRTPLGPGPAVRELLRHVLVYVAEPQTADYVLAAAAKLVAAVPCYRLEFAKNPTVAGVLGIT